jgi:hypothetical protein
MEHLVEGGEEASKERSMMRVSTVLGRAVALEQQRGERRRQRQRVERGDHRRDRDGHRELLVELPVRPGHERQRHEHRDQRQRDGDDGPAHFLHGLVGGLARREPALDVALDVLHHHDGIVHHDADGQHHAEQRQRVDREAEASISAERADDRHRHGQQRNDRRAPGLQEHDHHDHHQRDGFEQRVHDRLDARARTASGHRRSRIPRLRASSALQLPSSRARRRRSASALAPGAWKMTERTAGLLSSSAAQRVLRRAEFDARHVAQVGDDAVGRALDDDVAEFAPRSSAGPARSR